MLKRTRKKIELNKTKNKITVKICYFCIFRLCKHQVFIEEQTGQKTVQYSKTSVQLCVQNRT